MGLGEVFNCCVGVCPDVLSFFYCMLHTKGCFLNFGGDVFPQKSNVQRFQAKDSSIFDASAVFSFVY